MKVFVGGSRHVSRLNERVRERLDKIIQKRLPILIGDASGADKAVQQYLHSKHYPSVQVFCAGNLCRNNIGNWNLRTVPTETRNRTFDFYAAKDRKMAREADIGLMIWDGKSMGTLLNVFRLIAQRKKVVIYNVAERKFWSSEISQTGKRLYRTVVLNCETAQSKKQPTNWCLNIPRSPLCLHSAA
jgi:hypothetical protein